ncbi:hypothetical protein D9M71_287880 [compost metagenome]
MTLAGHDHVFDPWQAHLGRLPGQVRDHGAQARGARGLGFLAAETTPHATHVDHDLVHRDVEHFGHQLLYFGGVLRGAVDDHAAVFGGHDRGNLGFQVEVFLAADVQRALQAVRGRGQGSGRIAALVSVAVEHEVFLAKRFDHIQHRLQVFVFDDGGHGRLACGFQVAGGDSYHRLADELDSIDCQERVAWHQWADVLQPRDVFVGDGDAHALEGVAGRGVDLDDARVGAVGQARIDVQLVRELQAVVDIHGLAGHLLVGTVVLEAAADTRGEVLVEQRSELFLSFRGVVMVRHKRSPESRCAAFAVR